MIRYLQPSGPRIYKLIEFRNGCRVLLDCVPDIYLGSTSIFVGSDFPAFSFPSFLVDIFRFMVLAVHPRAGLLRGWPGQPESGTSSRGVLPNCSWYGLANFPLSGRSVIRVTCGILGFERVIGVPRTLRCAALAAHQCADCGCRKLAINRGDFAWVNALLELLLKGASQAFDHGKGGAAISADQPANC